MRFGTYLYLNINPSNTSHTFYRVIVQQKKVPNLQNATQWQVTVDSTDCCLLTCLNLKNTTVVKNHRATDNAISGLFNSYGCILHYLVWYLHSQLFYRKHQPVEEPAKGPLQTDHSIMRQRGYRSLLDPGFKSLVNLRRLSYNKFLFHKAFCCKRVVGYKKYDIQMVLVYNTLFLLCLSRGCLSQIISKMAYTKLLVYSPTDVALIV